MQVSLPIVRQFVKSVEEKALGVKVLKGVRPDQQLVKVVNDQLVELMGGQQEDLNDPKDGPQVGIFMTLVVGQGYPLHLKDVTVTPEMDPRCVRIIDYTFTLYLAISIHQQQLSSLAKLHILISRAYTNPHVKARTSSEGVKSGYTIAIDRCVISSGSQP